MNFQKLIISIFLIYTTKGESDLMKAMKKISEIGEGPREQIPSMGCNIKWK